MGLTRPTLSGTKSVEGSTWHERISTTDYLPKGARVMKLIVSIVNSDEARPLVGVLSKEGHRATMISTTGGFLKEGNSTILIGVEDDLVQSVLDIIKDNCHTRNQFVNPLPPIMEPGELYMPSPIEVQVGGATVFVLDVERFEQF